MKRVRPKNQAGYSLVELLIAMVIMGSVAGSAILATNSGIGSYETAKSGEQIQTKLHRTANRIVREVMSAGISVMGPAGLTDEYGSSTLAFQSPESITAAGVAWGNTQTIAFEYAPGEVDDGIDNNNNGLIDEGVIILTRDAGLATSQRVRLSSNVRESFTGEIPGNDIDDNGNGVKDEAGFNLTLRGSVLEIRICIEVPSFEGATVVREITTSTRMRN